MLEKRKIHRFNCDMYLLGIDEDGTEYWLQAPSWDCLPFVMAKIISILTPDETETADSLELKYKDMLSDKPKYKVGSKDYWRN